MGALFRYSPISVSTFQKENLDSYCLRSFVRKIHTFFDIYQVNILNILNISKPLAFRLCGKWHIIVAFRVNTMKFNGNKCCSVWFHSFVSFELCFSLFVWIPFTSTNKYRFSLNNLSTVFRLTLPHSSLYTIIRSILCYKSNSMIKLMFNF